MSKNIRSLRTRRTTTTKSVIDPEHLATCEELLEEVCYTLYSMSQTLFAVPRVYEGKEDLDEEFYEGMGNEFHEAHVFCTAALEKVSRAVQLCTKTDGREVMIKTVAKGGAGHTGGGGAGDGKAAG